MNLKYTLPSNKESYAFPKLEWEKAMKTERANSIQGSLATLALDKLKPSFVATKSNPPAWFP